MKWLNTIRRDKDYLDITNGICRDIEIYKITKLYPDTVILSIKYVLISWFI